MFYLSFLDCWLSLCAIPLEPQQPEGIWCGFLSLFLQPGVPLLSTLLLLWNLAALFPIPFVAWLSQNKAVLLSLPWSSALSHISALQGSRCCCWLGVTPELKDSGDGSEPEARLPCQVCSGLKLWFFIKFVGISYSFLCQICQVCPMG